jgi:hypothetical protein
MDLPVQVAGSPNGLLICKTHDRTVIATSAKSLAIHRLLH